MSAKLKVNADGVPEVQDGMPVIQYADGREAPLDFNSLIGKVKEVSESRDALRGQIKEKFAPWQPLIEKGLTPEEVSDAVSKIKALDAKKLIDAGKVEEVVGERLKAATASMEADLQKAQEAAAAADRRVRELLISSRFAQSKFLKEKTTLTPDIAEARWGGLFEPQVDNSVVAKGPDGQPIYSRTKHGQLADFDEAIEILVESHPSRDSFMRGSGSSGSDSPGGARGATGSKVMSRTQFETLPPSERLAFVKAGGTLTD